MTNEDVRIECLKLASGRNPAPEADILAVAESYLRFIIGDREPF